jgi:hypothetical protein
VIVSQHSKTNRLGFPGTNFKISKTALIHMYSFLGNQLEFKKGFIAQKIHWDGNACLNNGKRFVPQLRSKTEHVYAALYKLLIWHYPCAKLRVCKISGSVKL